MTERLLAGVRVVDLAGEPAQMTGRILADLGAEVVKVEPPGGDLLRCEPVRFAAWNAGKTSVVLDADDSRLTELLSSADIVLTTPGWPGTLDLAPPRNLGCVWVSVTPFGLDGPRAGWRASDLGAVAASGNLWATGDADRAPVRCAEPVGYCHVGPEAAIGALSALMSGRPQHVDVSIQETILVANMGAGGRYFRTGERGQRTGAQTGRTREIWRCKDGHVSYGLRGGKARVENLKKTARILEDAGFATPAWTERDWDSYHHNTASDEELAALQEPLARFFASRTMAELYEMAVATNIMLAPANSPRELYTSAQLAAREFFGPLGEVAAFPLSFVKVRSTDGAVEPVGPRAPAPELGTGSLSFTPRGVRPAPGRTNTARSNGTAPAWTGTNVLEFGSGAAGPIATRYFSEHGATVLRVESRARPDFLRVYALGPDNPHGLEGSDLYDALNCGKLNLTLNLKHPKAVELVRRLIHEWADAVVENFAPRAMRGFGLDYDSVSPSKPDLVMVSACLLGNTGPHRDYPGFGGQGAALSGFNFLTGWPDREPLGPHGTITDSLAPRFVATALAAGLLYRRRTGRGAYFDIAQVEAAAWTLSPWLLDFHVNGRITGRTGNDNPRALLHGVYPCAGDDRWVAIAVWSTEELDRLGKVVGEGRLTDESLGAWAATRTREEIAEELQAAGVEAVPVSDFADVFDDPQLAARQHFVPLVHPHLGDGRYERNGFRLSDAPSGYSRPAPTLGQDNEHVLGEILGLSGQEQQALVDEGAVD